MRRLGSFLAGLAALAVAGCGDANEPVPQTPAPTTGEAAVAPQTPPANPAPAAAAVDAAAPRDNPVIEALSLNDWFRAVLVDRASIANPRDLETIARAYCEGLTVCRTAIWFDEAFLPREMPVSAEAVLQQAYAFGRTGTGAENSLWNCDTYPAFEAERACLPRPFR